MSKREFFKCVFFHGMRCGLGVHGPPSELDRSRDALVAEGTERDEGVPSPVVLYLRWSALPQRAGLGHVSKSGLRASRSTRAERGRRGHAWADVALSPTSGRRVVRRPCFYEP